jgi:hypothetical protein
MSAMKDWLASVEELVVEAVERGAKTEDQVFSYVYMYDDRVTQETVKEILRIFFWEPIDNSLEIGYPTYH